MALQIEVTGPVITSAGKQFRNKLVLSTFNLKCWEDGADTKTDPPVIEEDFTYQQKTEVEGKTTDELAKRVEEQAKIDIRKAIEKYKNLPIPYETMVENDPRVKQMASNIQGAING